MDLEITKSDGTSFLLSDHQIYIDDFIVGSISIESEYQTVGGRPGRVDYGAEHGVRNIRVPFQLKANDLLGYPLARDTLYGLVLDTESFFVRELRRPKLQQYDFVDMTGSAIDENGDRKWSEDSDNVYVGGKRYLVRVSGEFDIEQTLSEGEGEITFETTELPYAESIGTSQDIQENGISFDDALWGFGMGLIADPDSLIYEHTNKSKFRIYNPGNEIVHPFFQDLRIEIDFPSVVPINTFFELKNVTNGSIFRVNEEVRPLQSIVLDGASVKSNGLEFLRSTNKGVISLEPGWNEFRVTGVDQFTIKFDFRLYYR